MSSNDFCPCGHPEWCSHRVVAFTAAQWNIVEHCLSVTLASSFPTTQWPTKQDQLVARHALESVTKAGYVYRARVIEKKRRRNYFRVSQGD